MNLEKLFNPASVAVVGATPQSGKIGNVIMKNLFEFGYGGKVYLINPKYDDIFSQKCYRSLADIEAAVDLAVFAIPAEFVFGEIEKNADKIKNYVIISAGFSETGRGGKEREEKLIALAKEKKLNILGPNCLGFIVPGAKLNASFAGGMPKAGSISFISQSGALAVALMDIAEKTSVKFSNIISVGNKMQLSESELLEYLAEDKNTKIIGMYLEGIKNGEKFIEVATRVSKLKPVIILKAGKNSKTQRAISSHTGALAGDNDVISAVFQKTGVLRARNLEEFFDLFNLFERSGAPSGKDTVIITNAGGVGVLTADAFNGKSIRLADLGEDVKKELREFLPAEASVENPIDLLGDAREDRYAKTLKTVSEIKEVGSIICILTPQDQTPVEKIAEEIVSLKNNTDKAVVTVFLGGKRVDAAIEKLKENGVCNFEFPDLAVSALDGYYRWKEFSKMKIMTETQMVNVARKNTVSRLIEKAKAENRSALYFSEAQKIMELYGVSTSECWDILPEDELASEKISERSVKFPVVLKVDSDQVLHKTDRQGLVLDIENYPQLEDNIKKMRKNFPGSRLIVQPMASRATELIVGLKRDQIFGPVVVYGLGGIYTEFLHLVDYLVPPLNLAQIEDSLAGGKLGFLFEGARGQKKYDLAEFARVLLGVLFMSLENPQIREFDINPLLVYNDGKKAMAVDVKIII